jgi:hypothetical protein
MACLEEPVFSFRPTMASPTITANVGCSAGFATFLAFFGDAAAADMIVKIKKFLVL